MVCVYGGISLQTKSKGLCQPPNLLYFFDFLLGFLLFKTNAHYGNVFLCVGKR